MMSDEITKIIDDVDALYVNMPPQSGFPPRKYQIGIYTDQVQAVFNRVCTWVAVCQPPQQIQLATSNRIETQDLIIHIQFREPSHTNTSKTVVDTKQSIK